MNPDTEQIRTLVEDINKAWRLGRVDQLHEFFHPDMVIVGPGYQEACRGRFACVESYREFAANARVHEYTESDFKIGVWDETAVCTYAWIMTYERGGKQSRETGTDQFVFSRRSGRWVALWRYINFGTKE
jgi:uncharacterized protein (TIGR02246 family)